jgi:hypothetical protein
MIINDEKLHKTVTRIVKLLVEGKYSELESSSRGKRLTASDIQKAIEDYGRHLIMPPGTGGMNVLEIKGSSPAQWYVGIELWTVEEGRSDLTLELTLTDCPADFYVVDLDDLHVL